VVTLEKGKQLGVEAMSVPVYRRGVGAAVVEKAEGAVKIPESKADALFAEHAEQIV
jgi:hypothetical protein